MDVATVFPPLGLRIEAGPLVLQPVTDDVLPHLIDAALDGVHDPALMPFSFPWTDASAEDLPALFAQYHWGTRAQWSRESWRLELAVRYDGAIMGAQGFATDQNPITRTGETGSWLTRAQHGRGIGTRMRQAFCTFLFDHLDAAEVTSAACNDNPASPAVSRKVGYRHDGTRRLARRGEPALNHRLVLSPENFVHGAPITVTGLDSFRRFIGLDP